MRWQMIYSGDHTDFNCITDNLEPHELMVKPGVFFVGDFVVGNIDQQDCLDQGVCDCAVFALFEKEHRHGVVPAKFRHGNGLAKPW